MCAAEAVPTREACSGLGASSPRGASEPRQEPGPRDLVQAAGCLFSGRGPLTWLGPTAGPKAPAASATVAGFPTPGRKALLAPAVWASEARARRGASEVTEGRPRSVGWSLARRLAGGARVGTPEGGAGGS